MTQSQFMYELMTELSDLPDEEKYVVMNDYNQLFSEQIADGMSEEAVTSALASPQKIAEGYKNGRPLPIVGVQSIYENSSGKATSLSVFKFICLIPVAIVYVPVTLALGILALLLTAVLCAASVCLSVFSFTVASLQTGFILTGIGGIFFTLTFLLLSVFVFKGAVCMVTAFPKFMGRILKNKRKADKIV